MNKAYIILYRAIVMAFAILIAPSGCDEYLGGDVNCDECYDAEPDSADLIVYLTMDGVNDTVPLVIYNGKVEEDSVEWVDTAITSPFYLYVAVDRYYSVKAEYKRGDQKIVAVDGGKILSKHVSDACQYECWIITRGKLDVRLKYEDF